MNHTTLFLPCSKDYTEGTRINYVALQNLLIYYTWKNIKQQYKNNILKIMPPTWNNECELSGSSFSVSDIQSYIE